MSRKSATPKKLQGSGNEKLNRKDTEWLRFKAQSSFGNNESIKIRDKPSDGKRNIKNVRTEAKALSQDASWRHVFLSFYLCEVEGAGKDENVHEANEAL